jgi:hypothetical protein
MNSADFITVFIFGMFIRRMNKTLKFRGFCELISPHKYLFLSQTHILNEVVHSIKHCAAEKVQKHDIRMSLKY